MCCCSRGLFPVLHTNRYLLFFPKFHILILFMLNVIITIFLCFYNYLNILKIVLKYLLLINTSKYHVSFTDGKISVTIIYFYYLFFHHCPTHNLSFLSCRPFVVNATFLTGLVVSSVSWLWHLTVGVV